MHAYIPHASDARFTVGETRRRWSAPFLLGIVISAGIWATLAFGTLVSVSALPLIEPPVLTLAQ